MFRGKESSNRIELSRLVQDLLNFGVLGSLRLWGVGQVDGGCLGVSGGMGGCPHMHTHARTNMHAHAHTHMYRFHANGRPHWGNPCLECPYACFICMCVRVCMRAHACACVCAWEAPPLSPIPTLTPIHPSPTPQGGGPPESLKIQ